MVLGRPVALPPGIDEMPHFGWLRLKPMHAFLNLPVPLRQSRVLPQVLSPRIDDKRFEIARRMFGIVINSPVRRTIAPPHAGEFLERRNELVRMFRLNFIFHCNQNRPLPATAIRNPPRAGPIARAKLNSMLLSAMAGNKSSRGTTSGRTARHVGASSASPIERASVKSSSIHGVIQCSRVSAASATATDNIHTSVITISLRRSKMSPRAPAGSASRKNGSADAVKRADV